MPLNHLLIENHHQPTQSLETRIFTFLKKRFPLSTEQMQTYDNLYKGFQGERKFYHLLKKVFTNPHCIVLYDLLLEINQSLFQIDCLLIFQKQIYLLEIKNYEGEFVLKDGGFYTVSSNRQIRNPIQQLERSKILLEQFLRKNGFSIPIQSYVVFVNNTFVLYEASVTLPIIFPAQLVKFVHKFNNINYPLLEKQRRLAECFIENRISQSPYERIPKYSFDQLKKGVICHKCEKFLSRKNYYKFQCPTCDDIESISSGIMRSVIEFNTLFPNEKMTTKMIYEWCGRIVSMRGIRKILLRFMKANGTKNNRIYIFD